MKAEQHQSLGSGLILSDYHTNSSDLGEQQQQMEELQGGEQQLMEQQLIVEQYRQTLAEQQEQLLEAPLSDQLMPPHDREDEQLIEEHQRKTVSNRDLSDVEMVSAAKVDSSAAMTVVSDDASVVDKTLVTSECEEQTANLV